MLTKDVSQELQDVFDSLQRDGKEPTVALVKARLRTSIPMPAIITAIKTFKTANRVPKVEVKAPETSGEDQVSALLEQVSKLTQRIEQLETRLAAVESASANTTQENQ